jgi:hypothetical protein
LGDNFKHSSGHPVHAEARLAKNVEKRKASETEMKVGARIGGNLAETRPCQIKNRK